MSSLTVSSFDVRAIFAPRGASRFRALYRCIAELPPPDVQYRTAEADFEVYCAKELESPYWRDPALKRIVLACRESYLRYGKRPVLDEYDRKAAIYIARARYISREQREHTEEWLSLRFVPSEGKPYGNGELDIYTYKNKTVERLLGKASALSSSRLCGIEPFFSLRASRRSKHGTLSHRRRYMAESFAVMQDTFFRSRPAIRKRVRYISEIMRDEMLNNRLTLTCRNCVARPASTPALATLRLQNPPPLKPRRDVFAYEFPKYWLDLEALKTLLMRLRRERKLTLRTFEHYLGYKNLGARSFSKMGDLLTAGNRIAYATMTGEELRREVDQYVPEVPELKLTPIARWLSSIHAMLRCAKIRRVSGILKG